MKSTHFTPWQEQYICDWFDNLDESYLRELEEEHGDLTPRKAWLLTFGVGAKPTPLCPAPERLSPGESIAASVVDVQGGAPLAGPSAHAPSVLEEQGGSSILPTEVPESDTLWLLLTRGHYSLNTLRRYQVSGDPLEARIAGPVIARARELWARIVSEVQ